MSLDYDLFVIDPENKDTTPEQLRDCIHDAIELIDARLSAIEKQLGIIGYRTGASTEISLCGGCYCMTHTINGKCGKCGAKKAK